VDDQEHDRTPRKSEPVAWCTCAPQLRILYDTFAGMEQLPIDTPRVATVREVASVAGLLDAFNREFDTPTPGKAVLATRLSRLLAGGDVIALLTGDPAVAVALLTLRSNVWYDGPVALLDELYVAPELRRRGLGSALLAVRLPITIRVTPVLSKDRIRR
jgi:GNAT superfamily N-acetyltransferase